MEKKKNIVFLMFDKTTTMKIQYLKEILKNHNIENNEKPYPPHITVDRYIVENSMVTEVIDQFIGKLKPLTINFQDFKKFSKKVLFLEPDQESTKVLRKIKWLFDQDLGEFKAPNNLNRGIYKPHVTLTTNDDITKAEKIISKYFIPFKGTVSNISIFGRNMELLKKYKLY